MEDADDMGAVGAGRIERLSPIFDRHHRHLFNFFLRLTGQRQVAEDLTQEVFVRLLRYRASYRPGSPFAPWMWQIARNAHLDHVAEARRHTPLEDLLHEPRDDHEGAHGRVVREQEGQMLRSALARLEPEKRSLLLLSREPELGHRHLAAMLACSVGAVKVRVHRALQELKAHFADLNGGQP